MRTATVTRRFTAGAAPLRAIAIVLWLLLPVQDEAPDACALCTGIPPYAVTRTDLLIHNPPPPPPAREE